MGSNIILSVLYSIASTCSEKRIWRIAWVCQYLTSNCGTYKGDKKEQWHIHIENRIISFTCFCKCFQRFIKHYCIGDYERGWESGKHSFLQSETTRKKCKSNIQGLTLKLNSLASRSSFSTHDKEPSSLE